MIQSHGRKIALTFSGGIDSTVLAYWFCENDGRFNFLSPTPPPAGLKTEVHLIQACIAGAANQMATQELLKWHSDILYGRYDKRFTFTTKILNVELPVFGQTALQEVGYVPNRNVDNKDAKTFTQLGETVHIDGRNAIFMLWICAYCSANGIGTLLTGHQYDIQEWDELDSYRARTEDVGTAFIDRMNLLLEVGFRNSVRIVAPWLDLRLSKYQITKLGRDLGIDLENQTYSCYFWPPCGKCCNCIIRKKVLAVIAK